MAPFLSALEAAFGFGKERKIKDQPLSD